LGWRTLAASIRNPRCWEYSKKVSFMRGLVGSALVTTGLRLSGFCARSRYVVEPEVVQ
jgi:hypothetical protein